MSGLKWGGVVLGAVFLALSVFSFPAVAAASEMDILLRKLVEKGVLTEQEARDVRDDVAREAQQEEAARPVQPTPTTPPGALAPEAPAVPLSKEEVLKALPDWVKGWKWSGDLRLRHETQRREPATDRNRERFRLRFGFITQPWEVLEIGVRLATGATGDPVSTMQSFTNTFDKKPILLDKAYARYTPSPLASLVGGKMEIPFQTTYNVLDPDVTPEGAAIQLAGPAEWAVRPLANFGAFQVAELNADAGDPALFGAQGGAELKLPFLNAILKSSLAYYDVTAVQGRSTGTITNAPSGNTSTAAGTFRDDFSVVNAVAELTAPTVACGRPVTLVGDWAVNEEAADDDTAWLAGLEVGKVTEKLGSWKAFYHYRRVEPDAVFGALTDSDFGGGGTNHKGHRMGLELGLMKNVSAALTYTRTDEVEGAQNKVDTLQLDANLKY